MSQAPYMPLFVDAYLGDTTHLSTEEHGAYLLLLFAMWRRGGSVPDDDRDNARMVGLTVHKWGRIKGRLASFLEFENGEISQNRLKNEWKKFEEKRKILIANGHKGGRPASGKNKDLAKPKGSTGENQNKSIARASLSQAKLYQENTETTAPSELDDKQGVSLRDPGSDEIAAAVRIYNAKAERLNLPKAMNVSPTRRKAISARLKECGGIPGWEYAMAKLEGSRFLIGKNAKGWKADFDFVLQAKSFTRLMEGSYDDREIQSETSHLLDDLIKRSEQRDEDS